MLRHIFLVGPYKSYRLKLAFVCVFGLSLGTLSAVLLGDAHILLMRTAAYCRVSIVGLLCVAYFPLFTSVLSVTFAKPLLFFYFFYKSFSYSLVALGTYAAFGTFGWVAQILLLFTDSVSYVFLCWFLSRNSSSRGSLMPDAIVYAIAILPIVTVDYCLISPLFVSLLHY